MSKERSEFEMTETKGDRVFNAVITWLLLRAPLVLFICYGLYQDFNSLALTYFAGLVILLLISILDKITKILESKESK